METILSRHKNIAILAGALLLQFLLLAVQIKKPTEQGPVRLIRVLTIRTITPLEKGIVHSRDWFGDTWQNYIYVRGLREQNEKLQDENARLRMEQVRMVQDASQAQRLQALLRFKEQFVSETVAAQVIGTSGSEQSRLLFIDKGSSDGIKTDMAVITPTGAVGKIVRVFPGTAQVLEINDQTSGVGAILEKSRLQGILKGTPSGEVMLHYVMSDEKVEVGEKVLTSGGDRIFPKGLPIGTVVSANPGSDMFLNIRVKPAAQLDRVEEVLVITKMDEKQPDLLPEGPLRAADILAARLPSVPVRPPDAATAQAGEASVQGQGTTPQQAQNQNVAKPQGTVTTQPKPQAATTQPKPQNGGATKPATPSGPHTFVNGQGVKHVSDIPNGNGAKVTKPPVKPTVTTTQQQ
jgi:rod shape-determining protein MreC